MLNREQAKALIQKATSSTKYYATVSISTTEQGVTRFANSEISQNVTITDGAATITLYDGKKKVSCTTNALLDSGMEQLVRDAESMLQFVPEGEFEAFPFSKEDVQEPVSDGTLARAFGVNERAALVKQGVSHVEPGYTASGALTLTCTAVALGDTTGGFRYANYDSVSFNTVVTHESGTDGAAECISYTSAPDIVGCFIKAQATSKAALNPIEPQLGGFTVVLSPVAFGDLLGFVARMLNAKSVEDGVSFVRGKIGQKVFGENLTIRDDITNPELLPMPFDAEGNPRRVVPLIENGVVSAVVYDNKTALRQNMESTGHAIVSRWFAGAMPINLVVEGGDKSLEEIIASTESGIFVNEFHYTNFVNARNLQITGLTRNGTFLIENGKITKPIATVRFTESMLDAFNNISAISKGRELVSGFGAALVPAVRIENFHFTSKP